MSIDSQITKHVGNPWDIFNLEENVWTDKKKEKNQINYGPKINI